MTESKLVQTKNSFKLVGIATRLDKDGAFKQEVTNKVGSKRNGETYRSLRLGVKTSDSNEITVQMFEYEPEKVFAWNSDKKKADSSYKGDWIPFGQYESNPELLREQGYAILQSRVGFEYGEDGKLITHGVPSYVAIEQIFDNIQNGDSVVVEGEIRYSKYKNRNDEEVEQKQYYIKKFFKLKNSVDFNDEKFDEISFFEQEMVFVDADFDKKEGKVYVTGRTINYNKTFHDTQFIVNFKDEEGKIDAGMVKLADAFDKKFKFGDVINVFGDTVNKVIVEETEEEPEEEKDDLFEMFGGKKKPQHAQNTRYTARTYITEMRINGVDAWEKAVYSEDDFVEDNNLLQNDSVSEFGGKPKKSNPFDLGDSDEISDEDLPF